MAYKEDTFSHIYPPKTITREDFNELCAFLLDFKTSLGASEREITAEIRSPGVYQQAKNEGISSVIERFSLPDIDSIEIKLELTLGSENKCKLHIQLLRHHIFIMVTDEFTGWGKSVYEDALHYLTNKNITSPQLLSKAYNLFVEFGNILMVLGSTAFVIGYGAPTGQLVIAGICLFVAGAAPTISASLRRLSSPKKLPVIQEAKTKRILPLAKMTSILSFFGAIIALLVQLFEFFNR